MAYTPEFPSISSLIFPCNDLLKAAPIIFGDEQKLVNSIFIKNLASFDAASFEDKRVVVKGCGDVSIPESAYVEITNRLRPYVKSIMYGEPCSTVPIYKKSSPKP